MQIDVTADDIRNGYRHSCRRCPIALALKRHTGRNWWVTLDGASLGPELSSKIFPLPAVASRFIQRFDDLWKRKSFKPFSFQFEFLG